MILRFVVHGGNGGVPSISIENTGRPPEAENALPMVLGGLDPNLPSAREALNADVLDPENIVTNGPIPWDDVMMEHRGG